MIKRVLGVWGEGPAAADGDSDDDLTPAQRRKLSRRLVPGGREAFLDTAQNKNRRGREAERSGPGRTQGKCKEEEEKASSGGDDESREDGEENSDDGSSDSENPAMPAEEPKKFRGQFRCELCPEKVLLNEDGLKLHLESALHKRREKRFEHAKAIGVKAFTEECNERAKARDDAAKGVSKRRQKNNDYWAKKRERSGKRKGKDKAEKLSSAQIEAKKQRFQAKKERRLARRQGSPTAPPAPAADAAGKKEGGKKKRRPQEDIPVSSKKRRKTEVEKGDDAPIMERKKKKLKGKAAKT